MQIEVGSILEGKVTGITKFGAFVDLSEISNTYVENISDFLTEGQTVKVKVLAINENGKISLSIKRTMENGGDSNNNGVRRPNNGGKGNYQRRENRDSGHNTRNDKRNFSRPSVKSNNAPGDFVWQKTSAPTSFEDMMSKFKQTSDEKMSSLKRNDNPIRRPRRK